MPARTPISTRQSDSGNSGSNTHVNIGANDLPAVPPVDAEVGIRGQQRGRTQRFDRADKTGIRLPPTPVDLRYFFVRALKSHGNESTEPIRSAIASSSAGCRRRRRERRAPVSRSRTTSDFDSLRRRDSASIWLTRASGNRTVNVFMGILNSAVGIYGVRPLQAAVRRASLIVTSPALFARPASILISI
jgi:hypothetical protein